MNQIATRPETSINAIGISTGAGGASIAPQNLGEVVRFAEVMCKADIALPPHLRGNAGACMAVALQAMEWGMSPFAVASKSYAVKGAIAYEAQLIAAVVNTRSGIKGRLRYEFTGTGDDLCCKVTGMLDGEECEYVSPPVGSITTKNSPLWKTDPQQQLGYFSARSWARRHCPEVILGVYDREEVEQYRGSETARDVTPPSLADRLKLARVEQHAPAQQEGFSADFLPPERSDLTSDDTIDQEPSSEATSTDGAGSEAGESPPQPAADLSATAAGDSEAPPPASEPPADNNLSDDDRAWLKTIAKMLWAATGKGEQELLKATYKGAGENQTPASISRAARDRGNSIYQKCKLVCFDEKDAGEALTEIAITACCETREIVS